MPMPSVTDPSPTGALPDAGRLWPGAGGAYRLIRRLSIFYALAACAAASAVFWRPLRLPPAPALVRFAEGGLASAVLGALLVALAGLAGTLLMTAARARVARPATLRRPLPRRLALLPFRARLPLPPLDAVANTARRPQGIVIPILAAAAAAAAWRLRPMGAPDPGVIPEAALFALGGGAILMGFPLLVAERVVAAASPASLPEAPRLHALLFVPVIAIPVAGCLEIASGLGLRAASILSVLLAAYLVLVAAELMLRALAQWFLPPPSPRDARAPVDSIAARLLRPRALAPDGASAAIRANLGIDFSRSWALSYLRSAFAPVLLGLLLFCWGLSGVSLIDLDQRGIYERFGAPVAVLKPGIHLLLPWPMGQVRRAEFGVVHSVSLGSASQTAIDHARAEDPAPPEADRLWDKTHPSEVSYIIASESGGRQSFQTVSVDLRVLYRTGLSDRDALRAAYRTEHPATLVRSEAGQLVSRFFAARTLPQVLGERREAVAGDLRAELQAVLDRAQSGIDVVAVVIEAIHPPAGAAEAYHGVQAAEIRARTTIATEKGKALALANTARQQAEDLLDQTRGGAAETVGAAEVAQRQFTADADAAAAGGQAFLLERYLANLTAALPKTPLIIVDHRLGGSNGPVIDLRPFIPPTSNGVDQD